MVRRTRSVKKIPALNHICLCVAFTFDCVLSGNNAIVPPCHVLHGRPSKIRKKHSKNYSKSPVTVHLYKRAITPRKKQELVCQPRGRATSAEQKMECSIYVIGDESHLHTVAITGDCAGFDCSVASFSACEDEIMPKAPASS